MKCQDVKCQQQLILMKNPTLEKVINYLKLIENSYANNDNNDRKPYYDKKKENTRHVNTIMNHDSEINSELSIQNGNDEVKIKYMIDTGYQINSINLKSFKLLNQKSEPSNVKLLFANGGEIKSFSHKKLKLVWNYY
ncbi:hypothetical protein A3Q56_05869 [Intoshia linei]|uniref:Uncharacterized protein n=1 Tax=Intoshia linei TaxID=1819745 RepID=A0A177AX28_9BILA|nr:hypothetical protein A3Q56_05869 [Intoshia linei]